MVWSWFIRSGQNHLARYSERGKKTRQTEIEVERQYQGMGRPGVGQVPEVLLKFSIHRCIILGKKEFVKPYSNGLTKREREWRRGRERGH